MQDEISGCDASYGCVVDNILGNCACEVELFGLAREHSLMADQERIGVIYTVPSHPATRNHNPLLLKHNLKTRNILLPQRIINRPTNLDLLPIHHKILTTSQRCHRIPIIRTTTTALGVNIIGEGDSPQGESRGLQDV